MKYRVNDGAAYIIKDEDSFELENITPDVIVEPIDEFPEPIFCPNTPE